MKCCAHDAHVMMLFPCTQVDRFASELWVCFNCKIHCVQFLSAMLQLVLQVLTSNNFLMGMAAVLAAGTFTLGVPAMLNLYFVPYWMFVVWLDVVTYLHHHGSSDVNEKLPWYRGEVSAKEQGHMLPFCWA